MSNRRMWIVPITVATLLLLVAALVFSQATFEPSVVRAQSGAETTSVLPRTITVVGEGSVKIKPDIAQANIGVEVRDSSVKEASAQADAIMDAVLESLKKQGIDEKDIQTSYFSIWAEQPYGPEGPLQGEVIYHVTNQVNVTVRDLDKVGTVLDAAIEAGANNIYGVNFSISDPSRVESNVRKEAVADARAKAEELAELNGIELGELVSVSEVVGGGSGYYSGGFPPMPEAAGLGGGGGISPGELDLSLQLQVVYAVTP